MRSPGFLQAQVLGIVEPLSREKIMGTPFPRHRGPLHIVQGVYILNYGNILITKGPDLTGPLDVVQSGSGLI